jgi:hypothetical protein
MISEPNPTGAETVLLEAISTFVDGERVEPDLLKRALALPEGRDYLVDLLAMREALGRIGPHAAVAVRPIHPIWRAVRRPAAAAIVLLALAGGYVAGQRVNGSPPPTPVRGPAGGQDLSVVMSAPAAPRPTRVIKLERGVNWSDRTGGQ